MRDTSPEQLNPWFSVWTQPRDTIQQIVDENYEDMVLLLAVLPVLMQWLYYVGISILSNLPLSSISLAISITAGVVLSIVLLYVNGAVTRWTGLWFDGNASAENIRAAIAWSMVPAIAGLSLMLLGVALSGLTMHTEAQSADWASRMTSFAQTGFALLQCVTMLWSVVIYINMLSQVQGFSIWKALGNALLSFLIIGFLAAAALVSLFIVVLETGYFKF